MLDVEKMNERFRRAGRQILRFRVVNLIVFVLLLAVAISGLRLVKSDTNQENYFLEGDALLVAKEYFESIFGNDDFCAVLVESDNIFDANALRLIREMGQELKKEVPYADDVLSLTDMEFSQGNEYGIDIADLVPEPIPEDAASLQAIREKAMSKPSLKNRIVSDDGRQAWIMLRLKRLPAHATGPDGEGIDIAIGRKVNEIAAREKYASLNPRTTGLPVINLEKRVYMAK